MTTPNAELAYRVLDHINAHPEQHNQATWIWVQDCGTKACFAGWVSLLSGDKPWFSQNQEDMGDEQAEMVLSAETGRRRNIRHRAVHLLNITGGQAEELFAPGNSRGGLGLLVAEIFGPRPGGAA